MKLTFATLATVSAAIMFSAFLLTGYEPVDLSGTNKSIWISSVTTLVIIGFAGFLIGLTIVFSEIWEDYGDHLQWVVFGACAGTIAYMGLGMTHLKAMDQFLTGLLIMCVTLVVGGAVAEAGVVTLQSHKRRIG